MFGKRKGQPKYVSSFRGVTEDYGPKKTLNLFTRKINMEPTKLTLSEGKSSSKPASLGSSRQSRSHLPSLTLTVRT